jgi:hypothetical protein
LTDARDDLFGGEVGAEEVAQALEMARSFAENTGPTFVGFFCVVFAKKVKKIIISSFFLLKN